MVLPNIGGNKNDSLVNPPQEGIESDGSLRAGSIRSSIKKTKIDSWDAT